MTERHRFGGSDRRIYALLLACPGLTDRQGAMALEMSDTTYRIQRWRLESSGLVVRCASPQRPLRWRGVSAWELEWKGR